MELDADLEAWLRLSLTPGLGGESLTQLLLAFRSPQAILAASQTALAQVVSDRTARLLAAPPAEEELARVAEWLASGPGQVLTLADPRYPRAFLDVPSPPPVLYATGRIELLNTDCFAIVGSRNATPYGLAHAERFARTLANAGLTIVSGLALGIDAAAHRGALAGAGSSVAVVGTGLDIVYPARNRELAHALARDGCLLSEFPLGTPPIASNFPRRNRLISGLARGCLVVEAALASGSLITARLANEQGKDVFAIPGSVHSPLSKGCHSLIKQGAKLAESAEDILEELRLPTRRIAAAMDPPREDTTPPALAALGFDPCDFDTIAARTGLPAAALAALLTQWELDGLIAALPGARYQRIR